MAKQELIIPEQEIVEFLLATKFFCELNPATILNLVEEFSPIFLSGGETLIRQGEQGNSLFLVVNGRLRAIKETSDKETIILGEMGRGELIGELALLTEEPRAATVIAIRDSVLLKLSKSTFDRFIVKHPLEMMKMVKHSILRVANIKQKLVNTTTTIAIAPAGKCQKHAEFTRRFIKLLAAEASTLYLNSESIFKHLTISGHAFDNDENVRLAHWLSEQELKYRFIVYETDQNNSLWTQRCLRQADRILFIAASESDPSVQNEIEKLFFAQPIEIRRINDLVLLHSDDTVYPQGTEKWLKAHPVNHHHHLKRHSLPHLQRLVRYITGKSVSLVLGGGGARGLAHIGVYKALLELKIPVDLIGGTSVGAIVGVAIALDWDIPTMIESTKRHLCNNRKLFDYTIPIVSLLSAKSWSKSLQNVYGLSVNIDDTWARFFCVATNLTQGQMELQQNGPIWKAIRASISLPAIVPPISNEAGDLLVDGSVINNLPVDVMRLFANAGKIIAINVSSKNSAENIQIPEGVVKGWTLLAKKMNPFKKPSTAALPSLANTVIDAITLSSMQHQKLMATLADLHITLNVQQHSFLDFKPLDELVKIGYEDTMKAFENLKW